LKSGYAEKVGDRLRIHEAQGAEASSAHIAFFPRCSLADSELFKPLPLTPFEERVIMCQSSTEATVRLGHVPFNPSALGELAPVVPSTVPVGAGPDYDEARQELWPVDKLL
jgi:hypothetical protein